MHRNFGLRKTADDYWNGTTEKHSSSAKWTYVAIGAAVISIIAVALFAR